MRLSASRLSVERGGRVIFSDLSFALQDGESLVVTGRNGAGKSTLLRALAGLLPLAQGELSLDGACDESISEQTHYIGHADALKGALTVVENLEFHAALLDCGRGGIAPSAALAEFGLGHVAHLPSTYLSAGQKRRAALAKLLVARRPIWLLDEPTTALDAASQSLMTAIMAAHVSDGGLIIAATHAKLHLAARELQLGAAA
ncbi:heme exporter subunit; ATP-binding component of ABC superfamily [Methylocella tundrae]|uniref:Heme exporter subunit ATP-binding component of ABC superfamily n=1 Tax=Methylocella tundrae TaxID=227605 RepID=A0A8B6M2M8_METTU|nr:heme ABC exporter ATP-binding protein CcmA [Methylocella tundrae]VTZ48603.1 heme exporter subunit; ATP-binding component of ABC superfamily [Methylocella tundrae]